MPGALHSHSEPSRECSCRSALHFTQPHIISCLSSRSSTARVLGTYAACESQSFRLITVTVPASLCVCSSLAQSRVCQDVLHQSPPLLLRSTSARGGGEPVTPRRASGSEATISDYPRTISDYPRQTAAPATTPASYATSLVPIAEAVSPSPHAYR